MYLCVTKAPEQVVASACVCLVIFVIIINILRTPRATLTERAAKITLLDQLLRMQIKPRDVLYHLPCAGMRPSPAASPAPAGVLRAAIDSFDRRVLALLLALCNCCRRRFCGCCCGCGC